MLLNKMVLTHLSLLTVFPTFRFYDKIISEFIAVASFEHLGQALVIVECLLQFKIENFSVSEAAKTSFGGGSQNFQLYSRQLICVMHGKICIGYERIKK